MQTRMGRGRKGAGSRPAWQRAGLVAGCLVWAGGGAMAQSAPPQPYAQWGSVLASAFGAWHLPSETVTTAPGTQTLTFNINTPVTIAGGPSIQPLATDAPLQVDSGARAEVAVPSAVACAANRCLVTLTLAQAHPDRFQVASATSGLQEAINYLSPQGGKVVVDASWQGSDAALASAQGSANVELTDVRGGGEVWYGWNGSQYQPILSLAATGAAASALNHRVLCDQQPGATLADKMTACYAALGAGGGIADARGFQGAVSSPGWRISVPGTVTLLGALQLSLTSAIEIDADQVTIAGLGPGITVLINEATATGGCSLSPGLAGDDLIRSSSCANSVRYLGTTIRDLELNGNRISAANPGGVAPNVGATPVAISAIQRAGGNTTVTLAGARPTAMAAGTPAAIAGVVGSGFNGVYPVACVAGSGGGCPPLAANQFTLAQAGADATGGPGNAFAGVYDDIVQSDYNGTCDSGTTIENVFAHDAYGFGININGNSCTGGGVGSVDDRVVATTASNNGESGIGLITTAHATILGGDVDANSQNAPITDGIEISALCGGCTAYSSDNTVIGVSVQGNLGAGIDNADSTDNHFIGNRILASGGPGFVVRDVAVAGGFHSVHIDFADNYINGANPCIVLSNLPETTGGDTLSDNIVENCGPEGVAIAGADDVQLRGGRVQGILGSGGGGIVVNANHTSIQGVDFSQIPLAPGVQITATAAGTLLSGNRFDPTDGSVPTPWSDLGSGTVAYGNATQVAGPFASSTGFSASGAAPQWACSVAAGAVCALQLQQAGSTTLSLENSAGSGNLTFRVNGGDVFHITPAGAADLSTSLAINGGTALTTTNQTGSGSLVLANGPSLSLPVLNAPVLTGVPTLPPSYAIGSSLIQQPSGSGTLALTAQLPLTGTSSPIGGSALAAGACASATVAVTGAASSMAVAVSPVSAPLASAAQGLAIWGFVSAPGTVTVEVCALVPTTPQATAYDVRLIQ